MYEGVRTGRALVLGVSPGSPRVATPAVLLAALVDTQTPYRELVSAGYLPPELKQAGMTAAHARAGGCSASICEARQPPRVPSTSPGSCRNARPRCESAFFSSIESSALRASRSFTSRSTMAREESACSASS